MHLLNLVMESFLWMFSLCVVSIHSEQCGSGSDQCCAGFIWNDTIGNCTACKDGFIGDNCLTKCPEMYFGTGCTSQCNCTKDQCHHVTGCLQSLSKEELTTINILTDRYICTRNKTKYLGSSSYWFDKYNVVVSLMIVAAVLFVSYLVLILYGKKQSAKQTLRNPIA